MLVPITTSVQVQLIAVPTVFSLLAVTAVSLRFLSRRVANRKPNASDWVMVSAVVFKLALSGVVMSEGIVGGAGHHQTELIERYGAATVTTFLKIAIPVQIFWGISLSLCKLSILILYTSVFEVRAFIVMARTTAGIVIVWMIGITLSSVLICTPFPYTWGEGTGTCGDQVSSYLATGILNIVTDLAVLLLPLPYFVRLKMETYKKVVLICTFTAGIFTCVASALRIHAILNIDFTDITYSSAEAYVWSAVEPGLAITLACVPLLRPLLGGKHSKTGTALNTMPKSMISGTSNRGKAFRRIQEDSSEYQLQSVQSDGHDPKGARVSVVGASDTSSVARAPSEAVGVDGHSGGQGNWRASSELHV